MAQYKIKSTGKMYSGRVVNVGGISYTTKGGGFEGGIDGSKELEVMNGNGMNGTVNPSLPQSRPARIRGNRGATLRKPVNGNGRNGNTRSSRGMSGTTRPFLPIQHGNGRNGNTRSSRGMSGTTRPFLPIQPNETRQTRNGTHGHRMGGNQPRSGGNGNQMNGNRMNRNEPLPYGGANRKAPPRRSNMTTRTTRQTTTRPTPNGQRRNMRRGGGY